MTNDQLWTAGEMLGNAESSIGTVMRAAVADYYKGLDLDTAQAIRRAPTDTEAQHIIAAMRRGRWQDLIAVGVFAGAGVASGAALQRFLDDPRVKGVSPVALLGFLTVALGLAIPAGVVTRAGLVAGGAAYVAGAQMFGLKGKGQ